MTDDTSDGNLMNNPLPQTSELTGNTTRNVGNYREGVGQAGANSLMDDIDQIEYHFGTQTLLQIYVPSAHRMIKLAIDDAITLGRGDTVTGYEPNVDLTPFGAYRLGISRRHAVLKRDNNYLVIEDLNSRNGTAVNGNRIQPNSSRILKSGDALSLAKLTLQLTFHHPS